MSTKAERARRKVKAQKQVDISSWLQGSSEVFNAEQLAKPAIAEAIQKGGREFECLHVVQSQKSSDSDFLGYIEKIEAKDGSYIFLTYCVECAAKHTYPDGYKAVARIRYGILSDHTVKAMHKNQGRYRIEPLSAYGRKLAAEAAAEGPVIVN